VMHIATEKENEEQLCKVFSQSNVQVNANLGIQSGHKGCDYKDIFQNISSSQGLIFVSSSPQL
jgi:hypothetical protein